MELKSRVANGWAKFHKYGKELLDKDYPLKQRIRLFNSVVTPTVLYGSSTWAMTKEREAKLQVAQRRMIRKIVKVGRAGGSDGAHSRETSEASSSSEDEKRSDSEEDDGDDKEEGETWVQWIIRATRVGEQEMRKARVDDWIEEQRRRKWRWAGHTVRRMDGRWSKEVTNWSPIEGRRKVGGQHLRWQKAIDDFAMQKAGWGPGEWQILAMDREGWKEWESEFVKKG